MIGNGRLYWGLVKYPLLLTLGGTTTAIKEYPIFSPFLSAVTSLIVILRLNAAKLPKGPTNCVMCAYVPDCYRSVCCDIKIPQYVAK